VQAACPDTILGLRLPGGVIRIRLSLVDPDEVATVFFDLVDEELARDASVCVIEDLV